MNRKYNLKLDLQFRCNNSTMKFNQFDNNTSDFFMRITNGGNLVDIEKAIVVLAIIKPSGKVASQFVEVENGLVYADLKPNMRDEIGIYTAQAMLILEDERVVTDVISYEVEEDKIFSLLNDTVGTSEEFTLLTDMLSRLSAIEISEEQRVINEAERILSEENRKIEEAKRVEAELIRQHEEADRAKYDATRESNENIRKINEEARISSENVRLENEANRIEQEANRVKAEQLRKDNYNLMTEDEERRRSEANAHKEAEVLRFQAETNRVNEEAKRRTTEQARVSAENTRVSNENTRKANETTRQTNETHRVEAETQRQNRYNSFILEAEANANNFENYTNNAKIKEEERKSNELNRKSQEDRRVSNEVERISNENTRKANENARIESEKQRVDAENLRKEKIIEIQSDYDSLKKVIIDENASANLQNQINQTNSQLEHKANTSDLDIERKRIDSFTRLEEGSTTGDAELIDARVGFDGFVYKNLGSSIRSQNSNIKKIIDSITYSNNMLTDAPKVDNAYYDYKEYSSEQYSYFKVNIKSGVTYHFYPRVRIIDIQNSSGSTIINLNKECNTGKPYEYTATGDYTACITMYNNDIKSNLASVSTLSDYNEVMGLGKYELQNSVIMSQHNEFKTLKDRIDNVKDLTITTDNIATKSEYTPNAFCREGNIVVDNSGQYGIFKIPIEKGTEYVFYPKIRMISYYNELGNYSSFDESMKGNATPSITPSISGTAYVTIYQSDLENIKIFKNAVSDVNKVTEYGKYNLNNKVSISNHDDVIALKDSIAYSSNLLTESPYVEGYYHLGNSGIIQSSSYGYYNVKLKAGTTYYFYPKIRVLTLYTTEGELHSADNTPNVNCNTQYSFTPDQDFDAYVTYFTADKGTHKLSTFENNEEVLPIGKLMLSPNISIEKHYNELSNTNNSNVLYKKKWAVIGDSFTAGDFSGWADENGLSGKSSPVLYDSETKMYKTYPWWIMKRNNMTLQKFYQGGRTLATPADGTFKNSITYNDMYKQIDPDIDYITIYLGINDGHHMPGSSGDDGEDTTGAIPIGTEHDTTTATFYGAWNVLLKDLITLYPYAHIGILVSNGMDTDEHVKATIKMAKKWGIPYLNLDSGYDVPLLNRTRQGCRTETCVEAISIRNKQYRVSETNAHPNHLVHKYQSTFIENFLRSL